MVNAIYKSFLVPKHIELELIRKLMKLPQSGCFSVIHKNYLFTVHNKESIYKLSHIGKNCPKRISKFLLKAGMLLHIYLIRLLSSYCIPHGNYSV
jgi:hypothetical protein